MPTMTHRTQGPSVLVVNPGSSSLKLSVLDGDDNVVVSSSGSLDRFLADAPRVDVAAVRVVHGGARFRSAVVVDEAVLAALPEFDELAPLHNPPAREALSAVRDARPDVPVVACFDTAFHATLPDSAAVYAVPWRWTASLGVRRYGFHGLSHAYLASRAGPGRVVTCHLGAGASLAAVVDGRSVDTTMGFTPDDGLVMATRSGSVDPGALLWAMEREGLSVDGARRAVEWESGLLGVSGVSGDMREVLAAASAGDGRARLALDVYLHRLRAGIAAMAAAAGGLDVLVFSGGVGEHSWEVRAGACTGLGFLGVTVDDGRNRSGEGDREISPPAAPVRVLVIAAREDLAMAAEARALVARR